MCHASEYKNYTVECGDGSCASHFSIMCFNNRHLLPTGGSLTGTNMSDETRWTMDCFTGFEWLGYFSENDCWNDSVVYAELIDRYCPELIELSPRLFGHMRFVYTSNQSQVS